MNANEMFHQMLDDGYVVQWTEADHALHAHPRAWTVGRHLSGRPELLVSGLSSHSSHLLLDAFAELDLAEPLEPDSKRGRTVIIVAEPGVAMGAFAEFPTAELRVYQLVWSTVIDGKNPDRDQTIYTRGSTILTDPYGGPA